MSEELQPELSEAELKYQELLSKSDVERTLVYGKLPDHPSLYVTKEILSSPTDTESVEVTYSYIPQKRDGSTVGYVQTGVTYAIVTNGE